MGKQAKINCWRRDNTFIVEGPVVTHIFNGGYPKDDPTKAYHEKRVQTYQQIASEVRPCRSRKWDK